MWGVFSKIPSMGMYMYGYFLELYILLSLLRIFKNIFWTLCSSLHTDLAFSIAGGFIFVGSLFTVHGKKITFLQWFLSLKKAFIFARSKATKMITCLSKGSASYNAGCVMYKRNLNCSQALKLPGISEILYVW